MELSLRRRIAGALIVAWIVTAFAMATFPPTVELATLMFIRFSAMCPLFVGMSMLYWYRQERDRRKLVLFGVSVFMYICAIVAFELIRDDLYPVSREAVFEIVTGNAVAIAWSVVAAWLLEAGMKRQARLDRRSSA